MGRATVRTAVTTYFQNANLPMVGTVFSSRPAIVSEDDYETSLANAALAYVGSASGSSAVIMVNLTESKRTRHSLTGRGAVADFTIHDIELEVILANTASDAIAAQQDHDTLVDAITSTLRADPLLGAPQQIWSAGEFSAGVTVRQSSPFTGSDGQTVFVLAIVAFQAWEDIEGPVI